MRDPEAYRDYQRRYQRERKRKLYRAAISVLGAKCFQCGSTISLQIDHKNPLEKEFRITDVLTRSLTTCIRELKKCQLLCLECHVVKTSSGGEYHRRRA